MKKSKGFPRAKLEDLGVMPGTSFKEMFKAFFKKEKKTVSKKGFPRAKPEDMNEI